MTCVQLTDRALLSVTGPDAETFLQNIVTLDLSTVQQGETRPCALLTPQGKILFDFLVSRIDGGLLLDCRADIASDFVRRLMMYRLRAKVEISVQDESVVSVCWNGDSDSSGEDSVVDRRFAQGDVRRVHSAVTVGTPGTLADWTALRVAHAVAESGSDYELGDAFPHDVLLDQNGGIGFGKGCFIGQEVVSRMKHRGTARRRVLIATGDGDLPPAGTPIIVNERPIGSMGSSVGQDGLALVRIDKVKSAMDDGVSVKAGNVAISLAIPDWATFQFPETAGAED